MRGKRGLVLFSCLLIIVGMHTVFSQARGKGKLKGLVTDAEGNPLAKVKVKLFSVRGQASLERVTNADGEWKAFWIRGGSWNLDFEKIGYEPKKLATSIKEDGQIIVVETKLKKMEGIALTKDLVKELERGNEFFTQKKYDQALEVYQKMLTDNPEAYILNQNIANCFFEQKQYEKALGFYQKVIAADAKHNGALISIGNCYSNMGKANLAIEAYKKLDINKISDPTVLYNIGIFYFNAGKNKDAIFYLEKCVKVDENYVDGLYQLGMAYMGGNRNKDALKVFEQLLLIDKESDKAKQALEIVKALKQYTK